MLNNRFKYDDVGYNLTLKYDPNWKSAEMKVMVIIETIDSEDLKQKELLGSDDTRYTMVKVLEKGISEAKKSFSFNKHPAFMLFNFRAEKHLHLSGRDQIEQKEAEFAVRTIKAIEKYKPTHVLICGINAYDALTNNPYSGNRIGWVEKQKFGKHECLCTMTLDVFKLLEDASGDLANHLIFVAYHLSYLLNSKFPFSLSSVKPIPEYIDSKQKFDSMMELLKSSKYIALDTETKGLTINGNTIYTIQFACDKSDKGYVLALEHPQTPWSEKQINYFKKHLRALFANETPYLVTMNGKFDLRVLRRFLNIPIIYNRIWEITAGEHLLNEELGKWLKLNNNTGYYNLRAILCSYMNDFYFKASFTKEDRSTAGNLPPNDPDFLKYAAMDVCCLIPIMKMQWKRASLQDIKGHNYLPIFKRHIFYEMSDTVHTLSSLDECGSYIDKKRLKFMLSDKSPFIESLNEVIEFIDSYPETIKANDELLEELGYKSKGLFGGGGKSWVFSIRKKDHLQKLFIDILKLKPLETTKTGAPSINKAFIREYKDTNDLVEMYGNYQRLYKLISSYIKGWYTKLTTSFDGQTDSRLRPSYNFTGVETGRLSSHDPSLQTIPQRSKEAELLKQVFVAPKGKLLVHYDYSAHEVRGWAIVSKDTNLANAFREGQILRQKWIQNPTDEIKKELKTRGDIHIQNVHRFFGKWVEKSDPLRSAVKSTIFGSLYGKSASTLGEDTKTADLQALKDKLNKAYKDAKEGKCSYSEVKKIKKQVTDLEEEDRTEYAEHILDVMFKSFPDGARWTNQMKSNVKKLGYVYSPIGRIRRLYSTQFINPKNTRLINRQVRRGSNAPIQGFASELAIKAARITMEAFYKELPKLKEILGLEDVEQVEYCRVVHDANYYAVPYELVLPFIQITQYMVTYGVAQAIEKQFNLKMNIEPEVEFETATSDDKGKTWDWSIPNLLKNIDDNIKSGYESGLLDNPEEVRKLIYTPWMNKECVKYLDSKYPLLNVHLARKIYEETKKAYKQYSA